MANLRRKLRVATGHDCVETVRGVGYRIRPDMAGKPICSPARPRGRNLLPRSLLALYLQCFLSYSQPDRLNPSHSPLHTAAMPTMTVW